MKKLFFIIAAFPILVNAQLTFDPIYNLSNTPSATSDYHSVYSNFTDFYAAWGDNGQVLFKKSYDFGQTWLPNKLVTGDGEYPVISAPNLNTVVIIYHDLNSGVFVKRSTDGGDTWPGTPFQLSTHSSGITPQLIDDGGNKLYAVWEERPGTNYELFFSRSTDLGASWSTPVNVSNTGTSSRWVQIARYLNTIYCTWIETTTYPLSDIYFTKSTDEGITWTTPVNITNDGRPQNRIYMEIGWSGNIFIACDDITQFPIYNFDDIYLIKSTDQGNTWSTAINITDNPGHSNTPCIVDADPYLYFVWADNTESAPSYDNSDIYFKLSTDQGNTWQDSVKLCSNPETSSRPRICWGIDGPIPSPWIDFSVIWYDYSTGASDILARNGRHIIPVELTSFTAEVENNNVNLHWTTATETNNKGFDIQRKKLPSELWESLNFIDGHGTATELNEYSYSDKNLITGKYIYRLVQIDFDGSIHPSFEIEAVVGIPSGFSLSQNYPNPFNPSTTIKYQVSEPSDISIKIYDILGNAAAVLVDEFRQPGEYEIKFENTDLPSGVYIYRMNAGQFVTGRKMIVLK